ncbi:MAG: hypothetical protein OES84_06445 [Kiritimatiellaceae bacterium]|nr:hypothetical protein [Kiritimatiellaceae bacterium]
MNLKGFTLSPLAEYDITAKILSKKRYYRGDAAKLSPIDFALGWGLMSDEKHINRLKIKQNVRYYFWKTKDPRHLAPITISSNSANCHLIPATSEIRRQLLKVRIGSVVHLTGKLVQVNKANWIWKSSTSRDDTGNGACEIILVEEIRTILPKDP